MKEGDPQRVPERSEAQRAARRQSQLRTKEARLAEQAALANEVGRKPVKLKKVHREPKKSNIGTVTQAGTTQRSRYDRSSHADISRYGTGREDR